MALNILRGKSQRPGVPPEPLAIGDEDGNIFGCPQCARPLSVGTRRCPGCGALLVLGVQAAKAGLFVSLGLVMGMALGGVIVEIIAAPHRQPAVVVPPASIEPSTDAPASDEPTAAPTQDPGIPSLARSSLGQAATLHVRLATAASSLEVYLGAEDLDASAVARTLRDIASDAAFGASLTPRIDDWPEAAQLSADLATFYEALRATARDGLKASVRNQPAYRAAGTAMLDVLDDLPALDAATRSLASQANVDLPPAAEARTPAEPPAASPAADEATTN